jgi:hypothetical protein
MGAECDTDQYLVVANVRETLAVSKQTTHKFYMARFNLKKINEVGEKNSVGLKSQIGSQHWKI